MSIEEATDSNMCEVAATVEVEDEFFHLKVEVLPKGLFKVDGTIVRFLCVIGSATTICICL